MTFSPLEVMTFPQKHGWEHLPLHHLGVSGSLHRLRSYKIDFAKRLYPTPPPKKTKPYREPLPTAFHKWGQSVRTPRSGCFAPPITNIKNFRASTCASSSCPPGDRFPLGVFGRQLVRLKSVPAEPLDHRAVEVSYHECSYACSHCCSYSWPCPRSCSCIRIGYFSQAGVAANRRREAKKCIMRWQGRYAH